MMNIHIIGNFLLQNAVVNILTHMCEWLFKVDNSKLIC